MTNKEKTILRSYVYGKAIDTKEEDLLKEAALIGLVCFGTGVLKHNKKIEGLQREARLTYRGQRYLGLKTTIHGLIYSLLRGFKIWHIKLCNQKSIHA